jgi:hypothetical protein
MATYLVVLAVVKWETIRTLLSREHFTSRWKQLESRWSDLFKSMKSKKKQPSTKKEGEEQLNSRLMDFASKLRNRRGKNRGAVDDTHELNEISPA